MTTTDLAAALLRDVPRYRTFGMGIIMPNPEGMWLDRDEVLAALTAALEGVDDRAGKAADTMRKMAEALPSGSAIRIASFASADTITALLAQIAALRAERDALAGDLSENDKWADGTADLLERAGAELKDLQARLTAAEAERDALRAMPPPSPRRSTMADMIDRKAVMDLIVDGECYTVDELATAIAAEARAERLEARCKALIRAYDKANWMQTADYHGDECDCLRCHVDCLRAALTETATTEELK